MSTGETGETGGARVAAIDIGTNSTLLLIAEARRGERGIELVPVIDRATITRLGRGVDASRALDPAAIEDTLACLGEYARAIAEAGVTRVAAVGTSAMRDARGGDDFCSRARKILGVEPRVISGDDEAALTFAGALSGLSLAGEVVVFDLGGGSTEIIAGPAGGPARFAKSLDVGSVRLTERHVRADPPRAEELAAVRADARAALASLASGVTRGAVEVVGVAGTVTTLAAHALDVAPYDPARVHGARLSAATIASVTARLAAMPLAARRALRAIDPKRADVIVAGGLIVEEVLAWASAGELIVSDRGVRWGLARQLAEGSSTW